MNRTFEKAYSLMFNGGPKILSYFFALIIIIVTFLKNTLIYIYVFIIFYLFFYWAGYRIWTKVGVFQVTSFTLGLSTLLDLVTQRHPLTFLLASSTIASSIAMSLRCNSRMYLAPLVATAVFYLLRGSYAIALASAAYAATMPLLKIYLSRQIKGGDALCMFNSFIYSSVSPEGMFDYAFKPLGVRDRGDIHLYLVGGERLFVVSDFHPGPLRNIGGGTLVPKLISRGLRAGYDVVFLHGVGSHERDPISADEVNEIVDEVLREASKLSARGRLSGVRPKRVVVGDLKATLFSLGAGPPLAVISRVSSAADDIPLAVAKAVDSKGLVLVDAQNKFDGHLGWSKDDVQNLQRALEELSRADPCGRFALGIGRSNVTLIDPLHLELGIGGITAAVAECDGSRHLLIIIDGNNINSKLYNKILSKYSNGYGIVEVVTTDTHAATGLGKIGYRIVGERIRHEDIIKAIDRAVKEALDDLSRDKTAAYSRLEVEAEVFGENFVKLRGVVEKYKRFAVVVTAYILSPLVLPLLL
ncbi:MAG: DUF2070 family protein [Thermoproteus sp.]|nr:DUF2070 family protein [Thermoproteus sp.]